ncbi:TIGR03085 family metal-binding protein [Pengzhenrongella frigida]|uniref:TIGR03085 family protein n=1 Tax=Pengzhenrongella frigida TaxID=1259133 RepID=A0A4Q5N5B4_9MICO|nr:TIGR03085 family metal-binding protein [Cellulomonas sp. HLT2-17]RYV52683.1 TIGR03085 family protein [Cellulomonas sp. HLT2-17]
MTWHEIERSALVSALTEVGPDAPTLCEGWRSRHLAAHVVLRETAPLVAAGIVVPPLAGRTERAIDDLASSATRADSYAQLVARIAAGAPRWNPMSWAAERANLLEFFVHTEDVRRGAGLDTPRVLDADHAEALWQHLVHSASRHYRRAPCGVVLVVPGGPRRAVRRTPRDGGTVVVRGEVGELALHAFGRGTAARVHVLGDPADVAALNRATGA